MLARIHRCARPVSNYDRDYNCVDLIAVPNVFDAFALIGQTINVGVAPELQSGLWLCISHSCSECVRALRGDYIKLFIRKCPWSRKWDVTSKLSQDGTELWRWQPKIVQTCSRKTNRIRNNPSASRTSVLSHNYRSSWNENERAPEQVNAEEVSILEEGHCARPWMS